MPSRIILQGRTAYASRNMPRKTHRASEALNLDEQGEPVDVASAIAPTLPPSVYQLGVPFFDSEEGVEYRVLKRLTPADGWASATFWKNRWGCNLTDLLDIVKAGWMLAAIEHGSHVRRYLCTNERGLKDSNLWKILRKRQRTREEREKEKMRNLGKFFGFEKAKR
jgi:hypothetical protein